MMHLRFAAVFAICQLALPLAPAFGQAPRVAEIEAKLFFTNSGRFSANVLKNGKAPGYWNATIGAGDLEGPVNAVLFIIRVQGKPGDYVKGGKLKVTVREAGRFVINRNYDSGSFNTAGNSYTAILIDQAGCADLTIEARITAPKSTQAVRALVPFKCGE